MGVGRLFCLFYIHVFLHCFGERKAFVFCRLFTSYVVIVHFHDMDT